MANEPKPDDFVYHRIGDEENTCGCKVCSLIRTLGPSFTIDEFGRFCSAVAMSYQGENESLLAQVAVASFMSAAMRVSFEAGMRSDNKEVQLATMDCGRMN